MNSVEVKGLVKTFDSFTAVDAITFTIKKGEIFGLLGPNGAGKSTTVNMLTCQTHYTSGTASVEGISIDEPNEVRKIIGIVPQEMSLNDLLTAEQNVMLYGMLYGVSRKEVKKKSAELLSAMGLLERKDSLVQDFSGGMKQRLNVVLSLLHNPKVLFLDEPTTGMDPQARRMIWDFIKEVNNKGTTILLTTHYMEEADVLCDRVAIIDEGKIQAIDTPSSLKMSLRENDVMEITVDKDEDLLDDVKAVDGILDATYGKGVLKLFIRDRDGLLLDIAKALSGRNIRSISSSEPTLEDVFLNLTGKRLRD